jgi:hypothetical protein
MIASITTRQLVPSGSAPGVSIAALSAAAQRPTASKP